MLKKGDAAPPFSTGGDSRIHVASGEQLTLDRIRSRGPVLLVFLRGFG